jgi:hypothetical protein
MNRIEQVPAIAASILCGCAPAAHAAEGEWEQTLIVYAMGAAIDGDATIGDLTVSVDLGISDVFDALEMGGMLAYRADNGTWSFTADTTFMGLGATAETERGRVKGDIDLDQFTFMGTVGRRLTPGLEALFTLSYIDLSTDLKVTGPLETRTASESASWVDPMLGLLYSAPFAEHWHFGLRGDVGGFGLGSEFSYQVLANVRWQASDTFGVVAGYRLIGFDFEDGNKGSRNYERYDLTEQGPLLGLTISF